MSLCYVTSSLGLHGHTKLKRVWLYEATSVASQTACLAVSFVLGLLSLCSFPLLFQQRVVLCHVWFLFFVRCMWVMPYQLPHRLTLRMWLWDCREKNVHLSNFSQYNYCHSTNTNAFTVRRTNAYITDTAYLQHVNVGLAEACPNQLVTVNICWASYYEADNHAAQSVCICMHVCIHIHRTLISVGGDVHVVTLILHMEALCEWTHSALMATALL